MLYPLTFFRRIASVSTNTTLGSLFSYTDHGSYHAHSNHLIQTQTAKRPPPPPAGPTLGKPTQIGKQAASRLLLPPQLRLPPSRLLNLPLFSIIPSNRIPKMPPPLVLLCLLLSLCLLLGVTTETDLQILLNFKQTLSPQNGFKSWNPNNNPCNFSGITCNAASSVVSVNLSSRGLSGPVSNPSLCSLPALSTLSLRDNHLSGTVNFSNCITLTHLDLASNQLTGQVPDISLLTRLQFINVSDNSFIGDFPWTSLTNLISLQTLGIGDNSFNPTTEFPKVVLELTNLQHLYLSNSNIYGEIPPSIGNLTKLIDLQIADNFLNGSIPSEFTKLSNLNQLQLYNNSLTGTFPKNFGNLTKLQYFDASENELEGDISELRFLSNLISLQLYYNNFSGEVPSEFGDFKFLVNLSLYSNSLSGELPEMLGSWAEFNFIDVSTNFFTGKIPPHMCRMGTMQKLLMLQNQLTGEIPASYGNCATLTRFRVSNNSLSGKVPPGIWSLPNVNIIDLAANNLEGPVTADIGEAKALYQLYLADNRFSGELPPEIAGANLLVSIDTDSNQFSGVIPSTIGQLKNLSSLLLDKNSFSGEIPDSLGSCTALSTVNLASNSLTGAIPASMGQLQGLNSLDLSNNQLFGEIPASLSSLKLSELNLSSNRLTGPVPQGLSIAAYSQSFNANSGLCGDRVAYLPNCSTDISDSTLKYRRTLLTSLLVAFLVLLTALALAVILLKRRRSDCKSDLRKNSWNLKSFRILTFNEQEVIDSVKKENLIGKGGSGNVYRVELSNGKMLAVKHIWNSPGNMTAATTAMLSRSVRSREFEAEVATLSAIRHVNVVNLYCSITSEDSSLLVYEHLPNGSLWDRLHGPVGMKLGLDWEARFDIAVGSARGLEYLHFGWDRPIIHRDVKSSNILLDQEFKPRIADFGLARILQAGSGGRDEWSHVVAGTHGYIAPEYGYTWKVDEKSDVYSFGVVMLELVTGRRPIEPAYGDNKDIVGWVAERLTSRESVMALVDVRIQQAAEREEAVKMLRIATLCTTRLPVSRPSMRTVVQMLEEAGGKVGDGMNQQVVVQEGGFKKTFQRRAESI